MNELKKQYFLVSLAFLFLFSFSYAQENTSNVKILSTEDLIFGQCIKLDSRVMGEERTIFVHLPANYSKVSYHYPVIYTLDGRSYFEPFAGMVKYLSMYDMMPDMIVVAIEHKDRTKELTYTKANEQYGDFPTSGGAESFRKFISDELMPYIENSFRTHPFKILVGHSLGGLFALETLVRSPDLFESTIALDPSTQWNQFEWFGKAANFFDNRDSLKHFLFISTMKPEEEKKGYLDKFNSLIATKAPKDFIYEYKCFPEENHLLVAFPALFLNLKQLFQGWRLPSVAWRTEPDKIREHFQSLSKRFGFPVQITEEFLNGHAFHGLRWHNAPDEAIALFQFCLSLYPKSADAYEGLAEAYEKKGMKEKAKEFYRKALELNPSSANSRKKLEELE